MKKIHNKRNENEAVRKKLFYFFFDNANGANEIQQPTYQSQYKKKNKKYNERRKKSRSG